MNIFLTYDYELFFGENTGSVEKCLLDPTHRLLDLAENFNIKLTFFVDVGYLIKAEKYLSESQTLSEDVKRVKEQIHEMVQKGHSIQLHIHPHWERSKYENAQWVIHTENSYKLSDFHDKEAERIVRSYKAYLDELIGYKTTVFRAGGWCIQPFDRLYWIFKELDLRIDSSVFPGAKFTSGEYSFDFTKAPKKSMYRFEKDVCIEDPNGYFIEYPISSWNYSPLFYWRLYILGRIFPSQHKMLGDGQFLAQPGRKKSVLTNFTWNHASTDGYYSSKLLTILNSLIQKNEENMVIIGHPKSMTNYSFEMLERFISKTHTSYDFISLNDSLEKN